MIHFTLRDQNRCSAVFSGGAGGARAPLEFGGSEKGGSLISAYRSLAITMNTPGFKKLYTALILSTEGAQDSEFCLFFGRIQDAIICFRDLLTFSKIR